MPRTSTNFICQQCGYVSPSFLGKCPNCESWNSFLEEISHKTHGTHETHGSHVRSVKLSEIKAEALKRAATNISELDRVLGGGIVPGMAVLLAGEPGIGKSTLLMELAKKWTGPLLYVAGEESASQIKIRAERLGVKSETMAILEQTDADIVCQAVKDIPQGGLAVIDSIQTMTTADLIGTAGSVGQVRECASRLIAATKAAQMPLFLVGHVTKDGTIAGPKVLEHIVDTVLTLEGDKYSGLRLLRTNKNRFGPTDEVGVFNMVDKGLEAVADVDKLLADTKSDPKPGSCLTIAMEGTRPMLVEIQALVTGTPLPSPRRVASGVDYNRLQTIIAILQKRLNLPLYSHDIYVSVAGGLRLEEPAIDLSIALAILSSFRNRPLPPRTLAIGELDLLGNIRAVNNLERRIKEAQTRGFKNILSAETLASLINFHL